MHVEGGKYLYYSWFTNFAESVSANGLLQGGVHIMGEICPRSNPDIAHVKYSIDPLKLIYRSLLLYDHQGARFGEIWARFGHVNSMGTHILVPAPMFRPIIILFT